MNIATVIYHNNCADGFTSAWIAKHALTKKNQAVAFFACDYNKPFTIRDDCINNRDIYILDFSFDRETTKRLINVSSNLVCLDHHTNTQENLVNLPGCKFEADKCGAMMTWEHFFPGHTPLELVKYVQDYDLWTFKLPMSREINANIQSYDFDFDTWDTVSQKINMSVSFAAEGRAILRQQKKDMSMLLKSAIRLKIAGHKILAVNSSSNISAIGHNLLSLTYNKETNDTIPFSAVYHQQSDGTFKVSLRAEGKVNVTDIATKLGGGGHPSGNAAGFVVSDMTQFLETVPDDIRCHMIINPENQQRCPNSSIRLLYCGSHSDPMENE